MSRRRVFWPLSWIALACFGLAACGERGKTTSGKPTLYLEVVNVDPVDLKFEVWWGYAGVGPTGFPRHPSNATFTHGPLVLDVAALSTKVVLMRPVPDRVAVTGPSGAWPQHARMRLPDYPMNFLRVEAP